MNPASQLLHVKPPSKALHVRVTLRVALLALLPVPVLVLVALLARNVARTQPKGVAIPRHIFTF